MLDTTVWIAQIFLALFFLAAGLPKVLGRGIDRWVGFDRIPRPMTVLIGVSEVAAAVALVVPMLVDELQWTTPLAAIGLAAVCAMAAGFHLREQEWLPAVETVLWASLATAVVIGRWGELSTGPSISTDVLVPVVGVLVAAIVVNLAILFRQPVGDAAYEGVTDRG
ncbi:MAG TPA: DoxX family protein [Nocardioides sp.]|nr:DoxX family protein [Nocardioides sp.]